MRVNPTPPSGEPQRPQQSGEVVRRKDAPAATPPALPPASVTADISELGEIAGKWLNPATDPKDIVAEILADPRLLEAAMLILIAIEKERLDAIKEQLREQGQTEMLQKIAQAEQKKA